ncbi:TauD/TfdA family dioxygenase [Kutzneria sp. CA-103260]|uniref:TauD/TfdA family dioxygenase n=1 Tax=Kutzneria sp. CA-103260 TaxID=2802641 RepID=UPI001BA4A6B6|nr:TauD/TfdA family dioxygenase [Kutzneria sp. CA-103260]QUQ66942.1 Taurine catabolism dioxygenase TauD, TfdA family [Kutzneria sp. CA-103260]
MVTITEQRGPAVWRGAEIADSAEWRIALEPGHQAELLTALDAVAGIEPAEVSVSNFPLPTLGPVLAELASELLHGRGFGLLTGIPVDGRTAEQSDLLAVGIGGHVATVMPQGTSVLEHVRDRGVDPTAPTSRSFQHRAALGYHSDPYDFVALLCLRPAMSGGLSTAVSSPAVHNEIVRHHPDLAEVLYQPWWRDRRSGDGPDSFYTEPVYDIDADGRLRTNYGPDYIRSAQRGADVPPLSPEQLAAMAALDRLTSDPRFVLGMDLRPGDMQFLNNHVTMHSRTAFEDHPDPALRRDLIRLWLSARH